MAVIRGVVGKWWRHQARRLNRCERRRVAFARNTDKVLEFKHRGEAIRLYLPNAADDLIQSDIVNGNDFFESRQLDMIADRFGLVGAHVIDAGANIGNHSIYFAVIGKVARCLAFEPNPPAAALMRRNLGLNQAPQVELREAGLSDTPTTIAVAAAPPNNLGGTQFRPRTGDIPATTIDRLRLERLDFIKIDVEGMAPRVIVGGLGTLTRLLPPIFVELNPREYSIAPGLLAHLGYGAPERVGPIDYLFTPRRRSAR